MSIYSVYRENRVRDVWQSERMHSFRSKKQAHACAEEYGKLGKPYDYVVYDYTTMPSWQNKVKTYVFEFISDGNTCRIQLNDIIGHYYCSLGIFWRYDRRVPSSIQVRARNLKVAEARANRLVLRYLEGRA